VTDNLVIHNYYLTNHKRKFFYYDDLPRIHLPANIFLNLLLTFLLLISNKLTIDFFLLTSDF